jgi:hypothetical protein
MSSMSLNIQWFVESNGQRCMNEAELKARTGLRVTLVTEEQVDASICRLEVSNPGVGPVMVDRIGVLLSAPLPQGDWRVFLDGGTLAWAGVQPLSSQDQAGMNFALTDARHSTREGRSIIGQRSNMTAVLHEASGKTPSLLVSFLGQTQGSNFVDVWPDETGRRVQEIEAWGEFATRPVSGVAVPSPLELKPGESLSLDPLVVCQGSDSLALLEKLGDRVQARFGRTFSDPPIVGLMTWYAKFSAVDEDLVVGNLPIIADLFNGYPQPMQNVMIVDMGWQQNASCGPTQADRRRFPHGFPWLADKTREHGVEFGLWLCTTSITNDGEHFPPLEPYLVRDAAGKLVMSGNLADVTSPKTCFPDAAQSAIHQWWRNQIRELSDLGTRYFKLDFFATRTSEATRGVVSLRSMMDAAWQAFRESCPPGVHLAPCSCDTNLQLGRCDSVRIGIDIGCAGTWPAEAAHYRNSLSSIASMWFKQRRFWVNDPDSAQISKGCSLGEARVRATAVAFCGGHVMAGEDLRLASPDRLEILRRLMPVYPVAARPLDLFEQPFPGGYPAVWSLPVPAAGHERRALALFNVDAKPRRFTILPAMLNLSPGESFAAVEWWQSQYLGEHSGAFDVEVPAYDVAVIHAAATTNHPTLLSLSHHYTGGYIVEDCRWDETSCSLCGTLLTKKGLAITLLGHAPKSFALTAGGVNNGIGTPGGNWQYTVCTTGQRTPFKVPFKKKLM